MTELSALHLCAGDFHFGGGNVRVHTLLGTCVAITLWHPLRRVGGICHYLLPRRGPGAADASAGFYATEVMALFAEALRASQTAASAYVVKVFGGGHMFPDQLTDSDCRGEACTDRRRASCMSIGCQNISAAHDLLEAGGYAISSENVGGHGSRSLIFDLDDGTLWVSRGAAMNVPALGASFGLAASDPAIASTGIMNANRPRIIATPSP